MASLSSYGGKLSSNGLLSSNGGRLSNFGSGAPAAVTTDFSYAQFEGGQAGILDKTRNAARTYWGASGRTVWVGEITGTEALLTVVRASGSQATGHIIVSVDGGAETSATLADGKFTLFSGLADTKHTVAITVASAMASSYGVLNSGNVLTVTGAVPALDVPTSQLNMYEGNPFAYSQSQRVALASPYLDYLPSTIISPTSSARYSAGHRFKTDATKLYVASGDRYVYVSVDGAAPTRYDRGDAPTINFHVIDLDGELHTYNLWGRDRPVVSGVGLLSIGHNGTLSDVGTTYRLEQFGDSITQGYGATSVGDVETNGVASHFGRLGTTFGWVGETVAGLKARLPALLTNIEPTSNDAAVLAIGRNNVGAAWTSEVETDYLDCVNQLKAVYGKVLCRGILPDHGTTYPTENTAISGIVTGVADPNVVFIDTSAWTDIEMPDDIHPNDAGYDTLEAYCKTAYAPYLS
jgi:lysophospholipase L1-like esterase